MSSLTLRKGGTATIPECSCNPQNHRIYWRCGGTTHCAPLINARCVCCNNKIYCAGDGNYSNTIAVSINGTTYYAVKTYATPSNYAIPAGTYTPSEFRTLVKQYFTNNGTRSAANAFTVKVNNQTLSVSTGESMRYVVYGTSPEGFIEGLAFKDGDSRTAIAGAACENTGFTKYHCYVFYNRGGGFDFPRCFSNYNSYSITVTTGINFK